MLAIATLSPESTAISTIINQEVFFLAIYLFSGLELIDMLRCRKRQTSKIPHTEICHTKCRFWFLSDISTRRHNGKKIIFSTRIHTECTLSWKMYSHKLHLNNSPSLEHIHWQFQFNSVGNEDVPKAPLAIHPTIGIINSLSHTITYTFPQNI